MKNDIKLLFYTYNIHFTGNISHHIKFIDHHIWNCKNGHLSWNCKAGILFFSICSTINTFGNDSYQNIILRLQLETLMRGVDTDCLLLWFRSQLYELAYLWYNFAPKVAHSTRNTPRLLFYDLRIYSGSHWPNFRLWLYSLSSKLSFKINWYKIALAILILFCSFFAHKTNGHFSNVRTANKILPLDLCRATFLVNHHVHV